MRYEGRHAPCGTVVADELPEGYPVQEGVGLYCPRCREGFWSEPAPEPLAPERRDDPAETPMAPPPAARRRTVWPVVGAIAATAVAAPVALLLLTGRDDPAPPPRPTPAATAQPTPTTTPAPKPELRTVTRGRVTATLPPGWRARRDGDRVILRGPDAGLVTVAPGPRRAKAGRRRANGREVTTVRAGGRSWRITRYLDRGGVRVARSIRVAGA